MHNDPVYLLEPVYHWLDELIHQDGDYLYMALVYISLPLIIWILSGGLRRPLLEASDCEAFTVSIMQRRQFPQRRNIVTVPIIVIRPNPTPPPLPPDHEDCHRPPNDGDSQSFAT